MLVLRLVKCVRAAIEGASCGLIQTSTERVLGSAVLLGERFEVLLPWKQRADSTPWIEKAETDDAPTQPKKKDKSRDRDYYCGNRGNHDNDR